nr:unnamed protein product [Digitaria exilis]
MLSAKNEFVVSGCDVNGTLYGKDINGGHANVISNCFSTCRSGSLVGGHGAGPLVPTQSQGGGYCIGNDGCCRSPIPAGSTPDHMEIVMPNQFVNTSQWELQPFTLITEEVKQGFPMPASNSGQCPGNIASRLCKSENGDFRQQNGGYTCYCHKGYQGNAYIDDGCQDINECNNVTVRNSCFGDCNNLPGHFECRCPKGTHGDPSKQGGCVNSRTDIAERMIIPLVELAKATNNFDKARELGRGGHATALILMALHLAAATAVLLPRAPTIGKPGCATICGNMSVPYPFGLSPGCYWPGLNLTCDSSHGGTPRLLLGDGTLRVTEISLENATVRVMQLWVQELVVSGCNAVAWILADIGGNPPGTIIGGCASLCTVLNRSYGPIMVGMESSTGKYCNGVVGCCQASFNVGDPHSEVQAKWLNSGNHTKEQQLQPLIVFVTEAGWVDKNGRMVASELEEVPIVLAWSVTQGLPQHDDNWCPDDIRRTLCKSQHSQCSVAEQQGYMCSCEDGYDGNPYLPGGCQDIDECKLPSEENGCFGECINTMGSMECWCPHRTFGNPGVEGGCVRINDSNTVLHDYCNSSCGDVRVPYPFGISPGCYMPGFNLTCNKSYNPPRLLLDSDGILEVVNISLLDSTVRVVRHAMAYTNPTHVDATTAYFYIPKNISSGAFIDECQMMNQSGKQCFGNCINIPGGGHECRCPRGYFGNPSKPGFCTPTGDTQWILS